MVGTAAPAEVPSLTLRADRRFDILAMVAILRMARERKLPAEKLAPLEAKVRDFEFYEEAHRGELGA